MCVCAALRQNRTHLLHNVGGSLPRLALVHKQWAPMSDDYKIYVDAAQPATLNEGAGKLTDYPTLQEAVMAWHRLRPEQTKRATIKVFGGPVYTATEIVRLHFGPKPE